MGSDKVRRHRRSFPFLRGWVAPRWRRVLIHPNFMSSLVVGVGSAWLAPQLPELPGVASVTFGEVCAAMLAFAALAFAASVAGVVGVLAIPRGRLLASMVLNPMGSAFYQVSADGERLRVEPVGDEGVDRSAIGSRTAPSLYEELVFVFVYSASVQLLLAVGSLGIFLLLGGSPIDPDVRYLGQSIGLAVLVGLALYSFLQMAAVMRALASIGKQQDSYFRAEILSSSS